METFKTRSGCACCAMSRRRFVVIGGAACLSTAACLAVPGVGQVPGQERKVRIRVIYSLHEPRQARPDWPNLGFDFVPVMDRVTTGLRQACPEMEFLTSTAAGEEQAKQIVAEDGASPVDGYLVYQLNCWNRVVQTIAATGKPVLYADFQFGGSGGFLVYNAAFLRSRASNVGFVASSRFEDLVAAVQCFKAAQRPDSDFAGAVSRVRTRSTSSPGDSRPLPDPVTFLSTEECVRRLKECKILAVRDENSGPGEDLMTIPVERVSFAEVNQAWKEADKDESRAVADQWEKAAAAIVGVSRETLETSAAMYLGMRAVLKTHGANAITVNCLGGFYGGHIHAYPCLGFHQLCNDGLIGACECDVESTATMVAITALTRGRPGFISDPVIDTAKRQIIYAHCVATNRVFGPAGPTNPFEILTHSEDRQGASVRSLLPVGYMTTTLRASQSKRSLIFHQARTVANDPDDRACRTKLGAEPIGDLEKLFGEWDEWGWHRVTFYGDLKEPVFALADRLGWKIVQEV